MRTIIMTSALLAAGLATPAWRMVRTAAALRTQTVGPSPPARSSQGLEGLGYRVGPDQGRARLLRGAGGERQRLPDQGSHYTQATGELVTARLR